MLIRLVPFNRLDCAFQGSVKVVVPVILAHSSSCGWLCVLHTRSLIGQLEIRSNKELAFLGELSFIGWLVNTFS